MKVLFLAICLILTSTTIIAGTKFNSDGSSSIEIQDSNGNNTTFNSDGSSSIEIQDSNGGNTTFNSDGSSSISIN